MLARVGVDISVVRKRWTSLAHHAPSEEGKRLHKPFSNDVVNSLQLASGLLTKLPQPRELATEHILLGLASAGHDVSIWLRERGIDPDLLAGEIEKLHGSPLEEPGECWEEVSENSRGPSAPDYCDGNINANTAWQSSPVPILRVIDAAANRAREGMRVVEDYARMVLDDRHLTELCKQFRHEMADGLASLSLHRLLASRETQFDVGTTLGLPSEARRENLRDVLRANFSRLQEALRTLEEYGKLLDDKLYSSAKRLRYDSYTLQRALEITDASIERLARARLYILIDGRDSPEEFERLARSLIEAGVDALQLRDKRLGDRELLARARLLAAATRDSEALSIVNDRPDLAVLSGADGVHVGQDELTVKDARRIVGPDALVGVSTHTIEQARRAVLDGADYIGVGPVFPSETKRFEHFPGIELVRAVSEEMRLPAFAIGGINRTNVAEVMAAGAARVVVGGAIVSADDPAAATEEMSSIIKM
ncbi:MAG: thiamine phosphate synthase [Pirellulales bacterium]|nr:thiamine phosphate synthase [Pirellulales bacterium]